MRFVALDTETTGMFRGDNGLVCKGHRIVEVGCVEIIDLVPTGRVFHRYIDPGIDIQPGAVKVHGITRRFLDGKPVFADIVEDLLEFIGDSLILMHNANFDIAFLDQEFRLLVSPPDSLKGRVFRVLDTLELARGRFPGMSNSLDGLCIRFGLQKSGSRDGRHGALLDARLLAELCPYIL